jgi:signal transduction histidine kinase
MNMAVKSKDNPRRRTRTLKLGIVAALASVVLTMWAAVSGSLINSRQSAIDSARHNAANLAGMFDDQVGHTFAEVTSSMDLVATRMQAKNSDLDIYNWAREIPLIRGATVQAGIIGPDGKLLSSTLEPHTAQVDLSDREDFRANLDATRQGIYISHPLLDSVNNRWIVQVSRRVQSADGQFLGVIVFALAPSSLTTLNKSVDLGQLGMIVLMGLDDVVLARFNGGDSDGLDGVGKMVQAEPKPSAIPAGGRGSYISNNLIDGVSRIYAYRRVDQFPLVVTVGLDLDSALAATYEQAMVLVTLAAIGTLLLAGLSFILMREIGYRATREIQLADERMLLQSSNARLAEERIRLRQTNFELKHSKERAEAANDAKSQFLANMSHELRTPLNAIIGFSQIIKEQTMGPVGVARYAEYANDIFCAGEHLLALINNVLDISKIQAGKLELRDEPVDLQEVVQGSVTAVAAQATKNKIVLQVNLTPNLPAFRADPVAMRQILINLLSNAVKFTSPGGEVRVNAERTLDGGLALIVSDTGIGMTEEEIAIALEPFRQVENALTKRFEGTGLGLPIARRLVELHGGKLDIASAKGVGTVIRASLPRERMLPAQQAA